MLIDFKKISRSREFSTRGINTEAFSFPKSKFTFQKLSKWYLA